jgi:WD40 repeat protein
MRTFSLPEKGSIPDALQFSPDAKLLAVQAFGRIDVVDLAAGAARAVWPGSSGKVGTAGVGFTADGRGVVFFDNSAHDVHVLDLHSGVDRVIRPGVRAPWRGSGLDVEISAPSADGRLVFVGVYPEPGAVEVVAYDPVSGAEQFSFGRHRGYLREVAASPEGDWVAGCSTNAVRVWGIGGGKRPSRAAWRVEDRDRSCFGTLSLARGGTHLAVGAYHRSGRVAVYEPSGRRQVLSDSGAVASGVAFAPDRPLLAFTQQVEGAGEVVFWDAASRSEVRRFDWKLGPVGAVAFSPDGCQCATASVSTVVVWDVDV